MIDVTAYGADNTGKTDSYAALAALHDQTDGNVTFYFKGGLYLVSRTLQLWKPGITFRGDGVWETRLVIQGAKPLISYGIRPVSTDGVSVTAANRPDAFGKLDLTAAPQEGASFGYNTKGRFYLMGNLSQFSIGTLTRTADGVGYDFLGGGTGYTFFFMIEGNDDAPLPLNAPVSSIGDFANSWPDPINVFIGPDPAGQIGVELVVDGDPEFAPPKVFYAPLGGLTGAKKVQGWIDYATDTLVVMVNGVVVASFSDALGGKKLRRGKQDSPFLLGNSGSSPGTNPAGAASAITYWGYRVCNAAVKTDPGTDALRYLARDANTLAYLDVSWNPGGQFVQTYEREMADAGGGDLAGSMTWVDGSQAQQAGSTGFRLSDMTLLNASPGLLVHRSFHVTCERFEFSGGRRGFDMTRFINSYPINLRDGVCAGTAGPMGLYASSGSVRDVVFNGAGNAVVTSTATRTQYDNIFCAGFGYNAAACFMFLSNGASCSDNLRGVQVDDESPGAFSDAFITVANGNEYPARLSIVNYAYQPAPGVPIFLLTGHPGYPEAFLTYSDSTYTLPLTVAEVEISGAIGQWFVYAPQGPVTPSGPVVSN